MKSLLNVPIILASTSPRRIELMKQVRIPVHVRAPEAEEKRKRGESPRHMVARLARDKGLSLMTSALWEFGAALILSADTTVVAPDGKTVLGKPDDESDAKRMLKKLSGRTHCVFTAYCILSVARETRPETLLRTVSSKVTMRSLSGEMIDNYIKTKEPMDKAGSYAAQGLGMALIEKISGSYTNVVGLPMAQLLTDLEKRYGITPFSHSKAGDA